MIYGLELQARALTPQYGESNDVCFFIATNSLKPTNQLHLLQYDEEQGTIQSKVRNIVEPRSISVHSIYVP